MWCLQWRSFLIREESLSWIFYKNSTDTQKVHVKCLLGDINGTRMEEKRVVYTTLVRKSQVDHLEALVV
jgi:hypothetical protein